MSLICSGVIDELDSGAAQQTEEEFSENFFYYFIVTPTATRNRARNSRVYKLPDTFIKNVRMLKFTIGKKFRVSKTGLIF